MDFYWPLYKRFLYLILPMNILWKILDDTSKNLIRDSNISQNNTREDYSGKELYGSGRKKGGIIWDNLNTKNISNDIFINFLNANIDKTSLNVLEIGPGGGYYTRYIIEKFKVSSYKCIEVSRYFANELDRKFQKLGKKFTVIEGDALKELKLIKDEKYDLILFSSTFHHLVDREDIFVEIERIIKKRGIIIFREPCHYLIRIYDLIRKMLKNNYLNKYKFNNKNFIATHHFCTLWEFKTYIRNLPNLVITDTEFKYGKNKFIRALFGRYVSSEILLKIVKE